MSNNTNPRDTLLDIDGNDKGVSSSVADMFNKNKEVKPKKVLKGIYLDEDVLEVYNQLADENPKGWGSQLVSNLLRDVFEKQNLMPKK